MSEIKIIPLFNQSAPGIWDDFLRVRFETMQHNYSVKMTDVELQNDLEIMRRAFAGRSGAFAFAAYDGARMVATLNGDFNNGGATIRHIYVLPAYQKQRLGARLLAVAESAASLSAKYIDLVSYSHSEKFYQKHNYVSQFGTNNYFKRIPPTSSCSVVPVFHCTPGMCRACAAIAKRYNFDFNSGIVNRDHLPVFVYRDSTAKIKGFSILHNLESSPELYIADSGPKDWISQRLKNAIDLYRTQALLMRSCER